MKIGIIGLGLIGGSLFRDLKKDYDVIAVSQSQSGDGIFKTYDVLKDRELIFVCTAMNKTLAVLDELENILFPQTVVTDVCSLKKFVSEKQRPYKFIPSHPMAGTEHKGFENSLEGLFKGAKWVITGEQNEKLLSVIKYLGAVPVFTTPEKHDEAAAMISHMPMVIAQALMLAAKDNPLALEIASSGFRDMTRLALSNEEMACDMVTMNHKNIEQSILKLYKAVGELTNGDYPKTITELKNIRSKMFK
ncbi:MAG TPA: prephenate dehydrogenase/arogenate dehydrogenase family protein [Candidatus Stercorousia faecigallinarum]|nr:prephenate dehydrogenase/arogenate dehydrogenase family protein [Candidatus Stercorousia faecigallinarum]